MTLCVNVFVARVCLRSEFHHQEDSSTHTIKRMVWWCRPLTWRRWFLSGTGDNTKTKSPFTFLMLIKHALAFHSCLHMFNLGSRIKRHLCFRCSQNSRLIKQIDWRLFRAEHPALGQPPWLHQCSPYPPVWCWRKSFFSLAFSPRMMSWFVQKCNGAPWILFCLTSLIFDF